MEHSIYVIDNTCTLMNEVWYHYIYVRCDITMSIIGILWHKFRNGTCKITGDISSYFIFDITPMGLYHYYYVLKRNETFIIVTWIAAFHRPPVTLSTCTCIILHVRSYDGSRHAHDVTYSPSRFVAWHYWLSTPYWQQAMSVRPNGDARPVGIPLVL